MKGREKQKRKAVDEPARSELVVVQRCEITKGRGMIAGVLSWGLVLARCPMWSTDHTH